MVALGACSSSASTSDASFDAGAPEDQSAAPIASPTASTAEMASPGTTPLVTAPRITWAEGQFDGNITDITGDGARFVAVGAGRSGSSAWTTTDGSGWEEHEVPDQSFGKLPDGSDFRAGMGSLIRLGDTLYSFGATNSFNDVAYGAGWRWTDGQQWEAIHSSSDFFGSQVIALTASDNALVASTVAFGGGPRGTLVTWRWTPAMSWEKTSLSPDVIVGALSWADETFIAAGSSALAASGTQPSLWTSPDGLDWTSTAVPEGMSEVCALISTADAGFLAFGRAGDRIAAWTSTDGSAWVESAMEPADVSRMSVDTSLPATCSVVASDGGLVAANLVEDGTQVWSSRDGRIWEFQETLSSGGSFVGPGYGVPLAALGDRLILTGTRTDPGEPDGLRQVVYVGVVEP